MFINRSQTHLLIIKPDKIMNQIFSKVIWVRHRFRHALVLLAASTVRIGENVRLDLCLRGKK